MTFLFPLLICLIFIIFCNVVHAEIFSGSFLVGVEEKPINEQMNLAEYSTPKISRDPNFMGIWSCTMITGGKRFCEEFDECVWITIPAYGYHCRNRRSEGESSNIKAGKMCTRPASDNDCNGNTLSHEKDCIQLPGCYLNISQK